MKIKIVNLEDGVISYGYRKMAAFVKQLNPDTEAYFATTTDYRTLFKMLLAAYGDKPKTQWEIVDEIAQGLAGADIVGFSSMTGYAELTKALAKRVREISPRTYQIWGGIHPIMHPEDAIQADVDAICVGEGEFAFQEFYEQFKNGKDYTQVRNFWFRSDDQIIRNTFLPLMTDEDMENLPFPWYDEGEKIFRAGKGFVPMTKNDYLSSNGLSYMTIWSIGCPFHCAFCGNTKFIANDKKYKKLRHPSPRYIVNEVKNVLAKHPHVSTVAFNDDSFMAIPFGPIEELAELWRKEVDIPFVVYGVIPNYVFEKKLEILTWAGMNRIRMGVQSGSKRILDFYRRPAPPERVLESATTINRFKQHHIPPGFDIILDNPIETRQDVVDTLELLYELPRPFTLNLYSLKIIPNTDLERLMKQEGLDVEEISSNYTHIAPTFANLLVYLITVFRPPRWLWNRLLGRAKALETAQPHYPLLHIAARTLYLVKRGLDHLRFMDFSVMTGRIGYVLWRLGILRFWRRHVVSLPDGPMPVSKRKHLVKDAKIRADAVATPMPASTVASK